MKIVVRVLTHQEAQNIMAGWPKDGWFEDVPFMPKWLAGLIGGLRRRVNHGWSYIDSKEVFIDGEPYGVEPCTKEIEVWDCHMKDTRAIKAFGRYLTEYEIKCNHRCETFAKLIMHEIYHVYYRIGNEGHVWKPGYLMFPSRLGRGWKI